MSTHNVFMCAEFKYTADDIYTQSKLWANSADSKLVIFFLVFPEKKVEISCKLSP